METHLPRNEIVRLVRGLLGIQTNSGLAAAVGEQHVAVVQAAALKVAQDCRWVNAQRRTTVTLNTEQNQIAYPTGAGPGSVMGMAVWYEDRYYALEPHILPVQSDTDQELAAGGDTLTGVLGMPRYFEQRDHIYIWPRTDRQYPMRIEFMAAMNLPLETSVSVVDAQLIQYKAAEMISAQMENHDAAAYYEGLYEDRLGSLRAWQSAGSRFALSTDADLNEGELPFGGADIPNWSRLPTAYPPVS